MAASVPERCPGCGAPLEGRSPYLPSYGRYECGSYADPPYETIECVRRQRDAARAEAEQWKQQYEAMLDEIERLRREREAALDILSREDIGDGAKVEGVRLILKGGWQ